MWRGMFVILISMGTVCSEDYPKVTTEFGAYQGNWTDTARGQHVASYLGIPYAKPPRGDLRFQKPAPWTRQWRRVREATTYSKSCLSSWDSKGGNEDCLYLNIFTQQDEQYSKNRTNRAVMVFLISNEFGHNDNSLYSPYYLLDQDVVLVTVNYRLGVLGFFTTGDKAAPGNYGLKDVLEALRWIQRNIEAFGGDPDNVTLMGQGTGAGIVHLLALSKKSKGLFHKYVTQSGVAQAPWSYRSLAEAANISMKLAVAMNCNRTSSEDTVECMRHIPDPMELTKYVYGSSNVWYGYGPVDEPDSSEAVITKDPMELIGEGKLRDIPWLTGVVADEALMLSIPLHMNMTSCLGLGEHFDQIVFDFKRYDRIVANPTAFIDELATFYFNGNFTLDCADIYTEMLGDMLINWPVYEAVKSQAEIMKSKIYFYKFAYKGTFTNTFNVDDSTRYGVCNGDEVNYLFPVLNNLFTDLQLKNTENDIAMINFLTESWANFAKTGVPSARWTAKWKPYQNGHGYMEFGDEATMSMKKEFLEDRMTFWQNLMAKHVPKPSRIKVTGVKGEATSARSYNGNSQFLYYLFILPVHLMITLSFTS